jgi:hypothetical protein
MIFNAVSNIKESTPGLTVDVESNYRGYLGTIYIFNENNKYYYKINNNIYQCPPTTTLNNILKHNFWDIDTKYEDANKAIADIYNRIKTTTLEIYEKGNILYKD